MDEQKRKLIIIILAVVLALAVVVLLGLFALNNNQNKKALTDLISDSEQNDDLQKSAFFNGELFAIREDHIEVVQNPEIAGVDEELGLNIINGERRVFNVSLKTPVTPVAKTLNEDKIDAKLSDLKVGQNVTVEYEEETKNAINININEE